MLSQNHLNRVCMLNCGTDQCRYLDNDDKFCLKLVPEKKKYIDGKVAEHFSKCKTDGTDPYADPRLPLGNGGGCKGYLPLLHKLQGYDIKP